MQKKYGEEDLYCDYCKAIVNPRDAEPGQDDYGDTFLCCPLCETELEVYDGQDLDADKELYCVNCIIKIRVNDAEYCRENNAYFCPICGIKLLNAK